MEQIASLVRLFAPTGHRDVATGGARLASAERNPWNAFHISTPPRQGRRNGRSRITRSVRFLYPSWAGYSLVASSHGLHFGLLRFACVPPVATSLGPIRGPERYRESENHLQASSCPRSSGSACRVMRVANLANGSGVSTFTGIDSLHWFVDLYV